MSPTLEYTVHGPREGTWITLSHPIGADMGIWAGQIGALAQHYRVLAFNTRGHGRSPAPSATCSVDDLAADVLQLWDRLDITRSHFVGLSLGGCIGVALAQRAAQRVASLVVACSRLEMDAAASDMWRQRAALVEQQGMAPVVTPTLARWLTPAFMAAQPGTVERLRQTLLATPSQGFAACARALADMHLEAGLAGIQVPTLFLAGQDDQAIAAPLVQAYARQTPGARFLALSGPHILNLENPAGFLRAVVDFLASGQSSVKTLT